jgi:predicted DNA-binding antitoxin AbrB/MazE fold protein
MSKAVNARFANGVFTPLEPVAWPEGSSVVLNIDAESAEPFVPHDGKFLPGMEAPQKIKQLRNVEPLDSGRAWYYGSVGVRR